MSKFSGKSDLADYIAGMGGWYDQDSNPVKFGQDHVNVYYSDEMKDFDAFKKKTGGVLHQHYRIKVDEHNFKFVKEHCPKFDYYEEKNLAKDKRTKSGEREIKYYRFKYWGQEYSSFKEINKRGVYITTEIHFNTILDLIKYYPYIVTAACGGEVFISNHSCVDKTHEENLQYGHEGLKKYYDEELAKHYFEICRDYLCYKLEERTKIIPINYLTKKLEADSNYYLFVGPDKIDYNHPIEYVRKNGKNYLFWSQPKYYDNSIIELSVQDVENFLKEDIKNVEVKIKYVKMPEEGFPLILNNK